MFEGANCPINLCIFGDAQGKQRTPRTQMVAGNYDGDDQTAEEYHISKRTMIHIKEYDTL